MTSYDIFVYMLQASNNNDLEAHVAALVWRNVAKNRPDSLSCLFTCSPKATFLSAAPQTAL